LKDRHVFYRIIFFDLTAHQHPPPAGKTLPAPTISISLPKLSTTSFMDGQNIQNAKILSLSILLLEPIGMPAEALVKAGGRNGAFPKITLQTTRQVV